MSKINATITQMKKNFDIKNTFFGKDKKTGIHQVYIELETRNFSVDVQTHTEYEDNGDKTVSVDLYLRQCNCETGEEMDETLDCITIHSPLFSTFEYMKVNFNKNKNEIYLDIYEDFAWEEDNIEEFSIKVV
jgi:hypothetical protein